MKKYLFLAEKQHTANLFKNVYEENKKELDFTAEFIGFNASTYTMFDKIRLVNLSKEPKVDVSKYNLPNIFYLLGDENFNNVINNIDLSKYDKIISIVDSDIYGAILLCHFVNSKKVNISDLNALNINSLTYIDIYKALIDSKKAPNAKDFVDEFILQFKNELYIVKDYIFVFDKHYKITLKKGTLVSLIENENNYILSSEQFLVDLNEEQIKKFNIKNSLEKY